MDAEKQNAPDSKDSYSIGIDQKSPSKPVVNLTYQTCLLIF